jgi:hypothetical protein
MPFKAISLEDMNTKYRDEVFWYVVDENKQVIGAPNDQDMEPLGYMFLEKEDAKRWKYVVSKSVAYQDRKSMMGRSLLNVQGGPFQSIYRDCVETMGEFKVIGITHEEAENLFEHYKEILLFYKPEEED